MESKILQCSRFSFSSEKFQSLFTRMSCKKIVRIHYMKTYLAWYGGKSFHYGCAWNNRCSFCLADKFRALNVCTKLIFPVKSSYQSFGYENAETGLRQKPLHTILSTLNIRFRDEAVQGMDRESWDTREREKKGSEWPKFEMKMLYSLE